ncbi:MAG: hypothetical protein GY874_14290 [Desulfobacteraceae bacterium]|nr:hypothetical protein [Desulfobacteraceae bacterium]
MNLLGIGSIIRNVGELADDLITTDEERLKIGLQEKIVDAQLVKGQLAINAAEARHKSIFVAGWRPAIGWVGAIALAYQFIIYPLLTWLWSYLQAQGVIVSELLPPPVLPTGSLVTIITGMLGIGCMRSYDKLKGTATDKIRISGRC